MVAQKVGHLHLLDALVVARQNLAHASNVSFHLGSVGDMPVDDNSLDFTFSHQVPDTRAAIRAIATKLKVGAPFLAYLCYALDNRSWRYRAIWRFSKLFR
ncbi:class I SAM-dependent methyltransferase [Bradyrhizobium retamae]|uniref:class I SAM-dependent methyltransferase n=1 Tax=Bradyrhizobium retamae TaxID=1300035 RepID=UPI001FD903CC|nr:class I SAM-dependent methyltransferase [Bradyrhizobium retamae]